MQVERTSELLRKPLFDESSEEGDEAGRVIQWISRGIQGSGSTLTTAWFAYCRARKREMSMAVRLRKECDSEWMSAVMEQAEECGWDSSTRCCEQEERDVARRPRG